jgi:hypothetical protein
MLSGNVTLHPFNSGAAAMLRACPERAQRVEWETSLTISANSLRNGQTTFRDSSASLGMTKREEGAVSVAESVKICVNLWPRYAR